MIIAFRAISSGSVRLKEIGSLKDILSLAISLEFYHNHTLIYDDIYYEDMIPEGRIDSSLFASRVV